MAIKFVSKSEEQKSVANEMPRKANGHSKPLPVNLDLDKPGWLRAGHLQHLFSISHSTLYNRIKEGKIPPPDGKDGARPYWRTETIKKVLAQ